MDDDYVGWNNVGMPEVYRRRPDTSAYRISPGDLDVGIKALPVFRGEGDTERQGAGSERVSAFRERLMNGAEACLD